MEYYDFGASLMRMDDGLRNGTTPTFFETIYSAETTEFPGYGFVNATVGIIRFDIRYSGGELDEEREMYMEQNIHNAYHVLFQESSKLFRSLEYVKDITFAGNCMIVVADTVLKIQIDGMFDAMAKENSMFKALSSKVKMICNDIELEISESMYYGKTRIERMYQPNGNCFFTFSGNGVQKAFDHLMYAKNGELVLSPKIALNLNDANMKLTEEIDEAKGSGLRKCRVINISMDEYLKR